MKTIFTSAFLFIPLLLLLSLPLKALEGTDPEIASNDYPVVVIEELRTEEEVKVAYKILNEKLTTLKGARRNATTKMEKKEIKEEIRATKKQIREVIQVAKKIGAEVWLGTGAILAIIILLVLI